MLNGKSLTPDVYCFDDNGKMLTGWVKDINNVWHYFEATKNENEGKMVYGWKEVEQGKWYYFDAQGILLVNTITPDGKRVNSEGLLIN